MQCAFELSCDIFKEKVELHLSPFLLFIFVHVAMGYLIDREYVDFLHLTSFELARDTIFFFKFELFNS
jgi:hypothetical protein